MRCWIRKPYNFRPGVKLKNFYGFFHLIPSFIYFIIIILFFLNFLSIVIFKRLVGDMEKILKTYYFLLWLIIDKLLKKKKNIVTLKQIF